MDAQSAEEALAALVAARRRIDELGEEWNANGDAGAVVRQLDELSTQMAMLASVAALLYGAARLIERGEEPADRRLERLSDHLHGYQVGWEDAMASRES